MKPYNGYELSGRGLTLRMLCQVPALEAPFPSAAASPVRSSELLYQPLLGKLLEDKREPLLRR